MKRRLYISGGVLAILLGLLIAATALRPSLASTTKAIKPQPTQIKVIPYGPTQAEIDAAISSVTRHSDVQKYLSGTNNRLLSFELIDADNKGQASLPPTRYLATFYDYTNNRVITAEGAFKGAVVDKVAELYYQPLPSEDEFAAAERVLRSDGAFSAALKDATLRIYRPMPPVISQENSNGHGDRIITLALMGGTEGSLQHEIVGINLSKGGIMRFPSHAPPGAMATPQACGDVPSANQSTTPRNTAGQYQLVVSQGQTELWNLLVIRPSVSSGTRGSGIELRDVKYRGKSVLKRGHVPVLDVQYGQNECGPYRDWQYQEGMFQTDPASTDPAPGIRISPTPATTALENGTDTGNFRGVDIYFQNNETVLVTEFEAGWYRYVMEWRLADDGTIRPRFGFGATADTCICSTHHHHAYWRFDFDIVGTNNNVYISEKGKKFLTPMQTETKLSRNYATNRRLIIQNGAGNEGYIMNPNITDGNADTFGVGDMWVLRYKSTGSTPAQLEIDDGYNTTTSQNAFIKIDPFVNGESVVNQDVVVWYGAHLIHDGEPASFNPSRDGSVNIISGNHVVGPDLKPIQW